MVMTEGGQTGKGRKLQLSGKKAFTMLEVLLALMLTGTILVATTFFIFSMGELWGRGAEDRLFEQHVRNVTRFLQSTIDQSIAADDGSGGGRVILTQPPGVGRFDESLITFELMNGPAFLVWPDRPLPLVVCYLKLESDGLFLLWHSRLEIDFEDRAPRSTLLTPFATAMVYDYYDPETDRWETLAGFQDDENGEPLLPTRLRMRFEYDGMIRESVLTFPHATGSVAIF
ncbi:MAG TPA: hypothetical protein VK041_04455 [Opitutales bacterium]|nr:hypothetical protein [Opitutales bacterium]